MGNGWGTEHRCELCLRRFRKIVGQNGGNGGPYQFCGLWGYRNDQDAGLIHVGARYYEFETGRWVQKDEWVGNIVQPQSLHRYTYCENNPTNCVDPDGNIAWGIVIAGVILAGVVSGIIADEVSEYFNAPGADHLVIGDIGAGGIIISPGSVKLLVAIWWIVAEITIVATDLYEGYFGVDVDFVIPSPGISH